MPPEVKGWNWGAFFLGWVWGIRHRVRLAFLVLIPFFGFAWAFVLGAKGSEWAWRNSEWTSVEEFKRTERKWGWAGLAVAVVAIGGSALLAGLGGDAGGDGSAGGPQIPVVARGGSILVTGTRIVCRVGTGSPVTVECGPTDAGSAPPGTLHGSINTDTVQVTRVRGGRDIPVFTRRQPKIQPPQTLSSSSELSSTSLANGESVGVAGTNLFCASTESDGVMVVGCFEAADPLGNQAIVGNYLLALTDQRVAVLRFTDSAGGTTLVFRRDQPATGFPTS